MGPIPAGQGDVNPTSVKKDLKDKLPKWMGKPTDGFHLDVTKDGKLIQKIMVDERECYLFGRNPKMNDFCVEHESCSRVHAVLMFHQHLNRFFLQDLGSTHGTFIGTRRIESNCPVQLLPDTKFHFGASTREYTLKEKKQEVTSAPGDVPCTNLGESIPLDEDELDTLTEYNTINNKRSASSVSSFEPSVKRSKKMNVNVKFRDEEEVINPEDIDPSVGKFRNLIHTSVIIPNKKTSSSLGRINSAPDPTRSMAQLLSSDHQDMRPLNNDRPLDMRSLHNPLAGSFSSRLFSSSLGMGINPTPDHIGSLYGGPSTSSSSSIPSTSTSNSTINHRMDDTQTEAVDLSKPDKKKYAKEVWTRRIGGVF